MPAISDQPFWVSGIPQIFRKALKFKRRVIKPILKVLVFSFILYPIYPATGLAGLSNFALSFDIWCHIERKNLPAGHSRHLRPLASVTDLFTNVPNGHGSKRSLLVVRARANPARINSSLKNSFTPFCTFEMSMNSESFCPKPLKKQTNKQTKVNKTQIRWITKNITSVFRKRLTVNT